MFSDSSRSTGSLGRRAAALVAVILATVWCSSESPPAPSVVIDPVNGRYQLFTSSNDGRLYQAAVDGGTLTVFGDRDDGGAATQATAFLVQEPGDGGTSQTWVTFDADGRVGRIVGPSGNAIDVVWSGDAAARLTAVSGNGKAQVQTHVDLASATATAAATSASALVCALEAPSDARAAQGAAAPPALAAPLSIDGTRAQVVARLIRCGAAPADADVTDVHMTVENATSNPLPQFPARPYDAGRYRATIPLGGTVPLPASPDFVPLCTGIGKVILRVCRDPSYAPKLNLLCQRLAAAMQAELSATPTAPANEVAALLEIADLCSTAVARVKKECDDMFLIARVAAEGLALTNPGVFGAAVCQELQSALGLGDALTVSAMVTATATLKGSAPRKSAPVDASAAAALGVQANVTIDFGGQFQVLWFETNPADPAQGESYTVRMKVACATGRRLVVTVKGTDGYHNAADYVPDTQGELFSLFVPGRPAMTTDTIKLIDAANNSVLRTIIVAFRSPEPPRSISGTASGAVAANVTVRLTGDSAASASTNASGQYSFTGLASGSYDVTPQASGYTFSPATRHVVVAGADVTGVSFTASQCPAQATDGVPCGAFAPNGCITGVFCDPAMGYECKQETCPTGAGWNYTHDCCCNCQGQPYQHVYDPCRAGYLLCCVPDGAALVCP